MAADGPICNRLLSAITRPHGTIYLRRLHVLALKGNQETLNDDVRLYLVDSATAVAQASQINKGHVRIETRTANISSDVAWLQEKHQWPGLAAVGKITASRQEEGHSSVESRYYLLGRAFSPERSNMLPAVPNPKCAT